MSRLAESVHSVRSRISRAAVASGRSEQSVTLVAVSKRVDPDTIEEALSLGLTDFAENRVEELNEKSSVLPSGIKWHFVGKLQRRKVRDLPDVQLIHSLDRGPLAMELDRRARATTSVLVQVNTSADSLRAGVPPEALAELLSEVLLLRQLRVEGFMTMAVQSQDPEQSRPAFRALRKLRDDMRRRFPGVDFPHLSMGMSQDYEVAVEEGSTLVRVGEAIFGPRQK